MIHANWFEICCVGAALLLVINIWFFVRVLRPLHRLSLQAESLSQGEFNSFEHHFHGIAEVQNLQRAMSGMVRHVRRAQEQRRVYTEQLADGQEKERKRIARELHDDTIQSIIAMTQSMDMARNWITSEPERTIQMLQLAREQSVKIITDLRNLIGGLRPPALEELGLIPALEMLLDTLKGINAHLQVTGETRRLDESWELTLFRVAQEALNNVIRHSHAQHVHISIDYRRSDVLMTIHDDGKGFHPAENLGDLVFGDHYGLLGIQERVENLDGWLKVESQIGKGTNLQVYLPTQIQEQPDTLVHDPVCSALIEPHQAYGNLVEKGVTYYFCCPVCQGAFQLDSERYIHPQQVNVN